VQIQAHKTAEAAATVTPPNPAVPQAVSQTHSIGAADSSLLSRLGLDGGSDGTSAGPFAWAALALSRRELGTATSAAVLVLPSDNAGVKSITVKGMAYPDNDLPAFSSLSISSYKTMYLTPAQAEGSDITEFVPYYNGTTKVVKYLSAADISNFETDTQYANEVISNGNKFIIKVTSANGIKIRYYWLQVLIANATLSATSSIKGQAIQDFGTVASTIEGIASATPGAIAISTVQVNGSSSTVFQETDVYNAKVKAVKYAASADISGFETDTAYNDEMISNNDFFIVRVTALDNITVNYYKIIVSVK
jgi:hypothetical protein